MSQRTHNRVGISLIVSAETEAAVEMIRDATPDASVTFHDCFYKIEREGDLVFDMDELSDRMGRAIDTDVFLVNMSSYYGRIDVSDEKVEISSEIQPARFRN